MEREPAPRPAGCEVLPEDDSRFAHQEPATTCLLREGRNKLIAFHHDQTQGQIIDGCVLYAAIPGLLLVSPAHGKTM